MLFGNRSEEPELDPKSVLLFRTLQSPLLNVPGPKSSKKYWSLQLFLFLPSDMLTIVTFCFPEEKQNEPSIQVLSQDDFYQHPVELEEVTTNELLGFLVDSKLRTVTYKLPEPWQIRDFASAGSLRLRLSRLQSRCHLISRYSYPHSESPSQIHSLILLYGAKGFSIADCYRAIQKIQKGPLVPATVPSCVSQTLYQREVNLLLLDDSCFSCRGTQEAHRAVSNEALYGVFRISGLITLTYLHW